ncbi:hypothetical protein K438DRAFT_1980615 [Mycena galopus ATCC 62051]|nr:hypothetical protein K438DRAFT_1980615 [Mycena galopus ATCC 62051]
MVNGENPLCTAVIRSWDVVFAQASSRPAAPHATPRVFTRMFAIHLRGDYLLSCPNLASWNSTSHGRADYSAADSPIDSPLCDDDPDYIKMFAVRRQPCRLYKIEIHDTALRTLMASLDAEQTAVSPAIDWGAEPQYLIRNGLVRGNIIHQREVGTARRH